MFVGKIGQSDGPDHGDQGDVGDVCYLVPDDGASGRALSGGFISCLCHDDGAGQQRQQRQTVVSRLV